MPARGRATAEDVFQVKNYALIVASFPHMHEIGSALSHTIERADQTTDSIIEFSGWNFDAQRIYEVGVDVSPGDVLRLRCVYDNPNAFAVQAGLGTKEEMCFDFLYVTPPHALDDCNDQTSL